MKIVLRVKTGQYTLSKTIELPVQLEELKKIVDIAKGIELCEKIKQETNIKIINVEKKRLYKKYTKRKKWTRNEVNVIKKMYKKHTAVEIAQKLGRTFESVKKRIQQEGFRKTRISVKLKRKDYRSSKEQKEKISKAQKKRWARIKGKKTSRGRKSGWRDAEIKYLMKNYKKKQTLMIAKDLKRTPEQVRRRYGYEKTGK